MGAKLILLVLSCCGSNANNADKLQKTNSETTSFVLLRYGNGLTETWKRSQKCKSSKEWSRAILSRMKHTGTTALEWSLSKSVEPGHQKTCLMSYANNKGADQPAHPRSLISAFIVRCLDSVMSLVSVTKISSLLLASVAEHASLSLTWSETPEDTFSHDEAQL